MSILRITWLLLPLMIAVRALAAARRDPAITPQFRRRSLVVLTGFAACAAVFVVLIVIVAKAAPGKTPSVSALVGSIIGGSALGTLWLIRLAPRRRRLPDWLLRRWSGVDWVVIALIAASLVALWRDVQSQTV